MHQPLRGAKRREGFASQNATNVPKPLKMVSWADECVRSLSSNGAWLQVEAISYSFKGAKRYCAY